MRLTMLRSSSVRRAVLCAAFAITLAAPMAGAQPPTSNKVAAQALFDEGLKLMDLKRYADACPKFADSQRLDPGAGTALNLASCYEKNGQTASAWVTYQDASTLARNENNQQFMRISDRKVAELAPKLSKLTITASSPADGMEIKRDGTPLQKTEWGLPVPIDPGKHMISATAPKKKAWQQNVEVGANAANESVSVPALEDAPEEPKPIPTATTTTTSTVPPPPPTPPPSTWSGQKTIGIVVGAVGVVGLGVGGAFALHAKTQYNDSLPNCSTTDKNACNQTGLSARNDARSSGNIASGFVIGGGVALVGGVLLFLTAPSGAPKEKAAKVEIIPTLGGALVRGVF